MARILILIVLGFILVQILKRIATSADSKPAAKAEEKMIQCTTCGCYIPISESQHNQTICNNPECQKNTSAK